MKNWIKISLTAAILAAVIGIGVYLYGPNAEDAPRSYRMDVIKRGDLLVSISATGTVEPEEVIDIGAQIAGKVVSFGTDKNGRSIDYGSVVAEGTILAQIDDSLYQADAALADAQVRQAGAAIQRAKADLEQLKAKRFQAERDWMRVQNLGSSNALSKTDFDAYRAAYEMATANVLVGDAAVLQAAASQSQALAGLQRARQNLSYCTIRSPVKGVIIDRRVNIGQTVVASLNAPSLFLLAKDLTRMQVWVAVNEADVGKIYDGQPVSFTVDAYPDDVFTGEAGKLRLNAAMTQNVVSYTVEVLTDNSSGRLLPYLTANVQFELKRITDVFLAPNAALRFKPNPEQIDPEYRKPSAAPEKTPKDNPAAPTPASVRESHRPETRKSGIVWIRSGKYVKPVPVQIGENDGMMSEVRGEGLSDGMAVIIGQPVSEPSGSSESSNPFVPQFRRNQGGKK